jgi:undecaprenyl-diphosphatase
VAGGALWEGSATKLGGTFWTAAESMVVADISAEAGKDVFRRPRPVNGNDPDAWFRSSSDKSFPSGEVTHISAGVTPFIAEYAAQTPAIWGLAALPLYDGVARLKSQAHWQTDVLAGAALGAGVALYVSSSNGKTKNSNGAPDRWQVTALPRGLAIGYRKSF